MSSTIVEGQRKKRSPSCPILLSQKRKHPLFNLFGDSLPSQRVILNVGGEKHEVTWRTLRQVPRSRLTQLTQCTSETELLEYCDGYNLQKMEFYFDWSPGNFSFILNMYRTKQLHAPDQICSVMFKTDLEYWHISMFALHPCCYARFFQRLEATAEDVHMERTLFKQHIKREVVETDDCHCHCSPCTEECAKDKSCLVRTRAIINGMDGIGEDDAGLITDDVQEGVVNENTIDGYLTKILIFISIAFVLISTTNMVLDSMESLQRKDSEGKQINNPDLVLVETICQVWFTVEYFSRLLAAHKRCAFVIEPLNMIDLIVILPYYIDLLFKISNTTSTTAETLSQIVPIFKLLRFLRILKFARYSKGFKTLGQTLTQTSRELSLLVMFMTTGVLLFASLAYFAEKKSNKKFNSILEATWWAVVTMTTVGYGDMWPITTAGKLIGAMCAVSGVIFLALPIPIIANRFEALYKDKHHFSKHLFSQRYRVFLNDPGVLSRGLNVDEVHPKTNKAPQLVETMSKNCCGMCIRRKKQKPPIVVINKGDDPQPVQKSRSPSQDLKHTIFAMSTTNVTTSKHHQQSTEVLTLGSRLKVNPALQRMRSSIV